MEVILIIIVQPIPDFWGLMQILIVGLKKLITLYQ